MMMRDLILQDIDNMPMKEGAGARKQRDRLIELESMCTDHQDLVLTIDKEEK
jgi:hypothetical protein